MIKSAENIAQTLEAEQPLHLILILVQLLINEELKRLFGPAMLYHVGVGGRHRHHLCRLSARSAMSCHVLGSLCFYQSSQLPQRCKHLLQINWEDREAGVVKLVRGHD